MQFYHEDDFLVSRVSDFAAEALTAGARFLVIATPAHRERIAHQLGRMGIDVDDASASERYIELDAAATLQRFMVGQSPDRDRFLEEVGTYVARFTANGGQLFAFGEMVALLAERGNIEAAVRLEELWCDVTSEHGCKLLCAYPMRVFASSAATAGFQRVCRAHSRVIPAETCPVPLEAGADVLRGIASLQQRALALEAEIAERKRVEASLRQREQELRRREGELRAFVETASQGLHWVDADGIIIWANAAELELLGYSSAEYVGRHIGDFHADPGVLADILERLQRGEKLREYEARLRCKNGTIKTVVIDSSALWENGRFVHTQCFTRDVTEQRRIDHTMRHWAAIVESSDDAILSKNLDSIITSWNPGAERIFGYTAAEAVGRPVTMLMPPERVSEEEKILARLRAGERIEHFETVRRRKDGTLIDVSLTISPVKNAEGRIVGASKIARDITDRRRPAAQGVRESVQKADAGRP